MGIALDIIKQLKILKFDWKNTNQHDIGLIAEDVEKIFPEAVWYKNNQIEGLKPLTLLALVIKAIQELEEK